MIPFILAGLSGYFLGDLISKEGLLGLSGNTSPGTKFIASGGQVDPKKGIGKKPKDSTRRLYTDENPSDTVSVKFRTKEDIINTLNKNLFKSKSHKRQSQIINLIHQRTRAAYENAKYPTTKKRLKRALEYIERVKEKSKEKTRQKKLV